MQRFTASSSNDYREVRSPVAADDERAWSLRRAFAPDATPFDLQPAVPIGGTGSSHPLVSKLQRFLPLDGDEAAALERLTCGARMLPAEHVLFHEDSRPEHVCVILSGMAYRYKLLPGGRRQILGYLIPGDVCDTHFVLFNQPDHCLALASDSLIAKVPLRAVSVVVARYPRIERALMLAALLDHAILREWLLNIGQRNAVQRLGHFLCEMHLRAEAVGLVALDGSVAMPINQAALADSIGQTPVHVNRTLQRLRKDNLILLRQRRLTILDPSRLAEESGFDAQYLRALHMCG